MSYKALQVFDRAFLDRFDFVYPTTGNFHFYEPEYLEKSILLSTNNPLSFIGHQADLDYLNGVLFAIGSPRPTVMFYSNSLPHQENGMYYRQLVLADKEYFLEHYVRK